LAAATSCHRRSVGPVKPFAAVHWAERFCGSTFGCHDARGLQLLVPNVVCFGFDNGSPPIVQQDNIDV
jgi:hypothetical protein